MPACFHARAALAAAALLATATTGRAQERAARTITATPAEFGTAFSTISALVELADGRVLIHDAIERTLGVADLRSGAFDLVARQGAGPLEYRMVASLVRVPGDSILLWDPVNARTLLLAPDGRPKEARVVRDARQRPIAFGGNAPREVDAEGTWYVGFRQVTSPDQTALVRIAPATGRHDTLMLFATPRMRPRRSSAGVVQALSPGFPPRDAWGVFPDGRVLLVHGATYTPEIVGPDGARSRAAAIPFPRVAVTEADRAAHLRETARELERMLHREGGPGASRPRVEAVAPDTWQGEKAPVLSDVIRVDSRGRAWVHALDRDARAGDRHDLLDASGTRVDAVRLPTGVRLVGMGHGVFYGAREDEDGLTHLLRYPLP
jgi:hypothetical protein